MSIRNRTTRSEPAPRKQPVPLLLTALLLAALFGVLLYGATKRDMREDEAITLDGTHDDLITTLQYQARDVEAPLYFELVNLWQRATGFQELGLRVFSVFVSMITLALVYRIAQGWLGGHWAGFAAVLALGTSAYFFVFAIEIRPYAFMMLSAAVCMLAFLRWMKARTWRSTALYGMSVALVLYVHYFGATLFIVQGLYFLVDNLRRHRLNGAIIAQGIGAYGLTLLLFAPWIPTFLWQVHHVGDMATAAGTTKIAGLGMVSTTIPTSPDSIRNFVLLATNQQPLLYGLLVVIGFVLLWRKEIYWLAVLWAVATSALIFAINLLVPIYEPRYASHIVPGIGLLIGLPLAALPRRLALPGIAIFGVLSVLTVQTGVGSHTPVRDYLQQAQALYQDGDAVFLDNTPYNMMEVYQYGHYAPSLAAFLNAPDYPDFAARLFTDQARIPRCIWFITRSWFDPTVRDHFQMLSSQRPLQTVIGDQRFYIQQLCAPPQVSPHVFGDSIRFLGLDLVSSTDQALTLKLWWDVVKPPPLDYSIGVHVLDKATGTVIAQSDGPINDFWGRGLLQTSSLTPGNYYIDLRTIPLKAPLSPGSYTLRLTVYQSWDLVRLPVKDSADGWLVISSDGK
ncbi:MAG TPA: glycosyltransferase family 39 protein [Aggregatilineales bacterium]|nr:glycosyltransferase family 39 protein [Aggregatilineales bacterium]